MCFGPWHAGWSKVARIRLYARLFLRLSRFPLDTINVLQNSKKIHPISRKKSYGHK